MQMATATVESDRRVLLDRRKTGVASGGGPAVPLSRLVGTPTQIPLSLYESEGADYEAKIGAFDQGDLTIALESQTSWNGRVNHGFSPLLTLSLHC
jgi:hypothetical protein